MEIRTYTEVMLQNLEMDETDGGTTVAKFSIVEDHTDRSDNEFGVWQNCRVYGYQAEMIRDNAAEGRRVSLSGQMEYWQYDGEIYEYLDVDSFRFVDARKDSKTPNKNQNQQQAPPKKTGSRPPQEEEEFEPDGDLPF